MMETLITALVKAYEQNSNDISMFIKPVFPSPVTVTLAHGKLLTSHHFSNRTSLLN